jgi:hypothetical protein
MSSVIQTTVEGEADNLPYNDEESAKFNRVYVSSPYKYPAIRKLYK